VVVPAFLLSDISLRHREKMLVIFLGSGSVLTILAMGVSIFVIYGPFVQDPNVDVIALGTTHMAVRRCNLDTAFDSADPSSHMKAYVALISANAVVIGTAVYSRLARTPWSDGETTSTSMAPSRRSGSQGIRHSGLPVISTQPGTATGASTVTYTSGLTRISSDDGTELDDIRNKSKSESPFYTDTQRGSKCEVP